eukprot:GHVH01010078.1.p4 GENE.GHVH01010078.1~~GHVH01010078.1.p4  ORF type:complete len:107 (-),score=16.14 GHVH01010078.1:571-891(-)
MESVTKASKTAMARRLQHRSRSTKLLSSLSWFILSTLFGSATFIFLNLNARKEAISVEAGLFGIVAKIEIGMDEFSLSANCDPFHVLNGASRGLGLMASPNHSGQI